jgi:glutamine synthetase
VKEIAVQTKNIRFEGDGYSEAWVKEAEKRGLLNLRTAPESFKQLIAHHNEEMLIKSGVLTKTEIHVRYHVLLEKYVKDLVIEGNN